MMNKLRIVLLVAGAFMLALACSKSSTSSSCTNVPVANDVDSINYYIQEHQLENVLKDPSGLYYQILQPGTGRFPTVSSRVYIKYTGHLINGTVFDQNQDALTTGWVLSTLIPGWQIGIPKINMGGKIRLLVPSALGYGCRGSGSAIPPNSVLIFDVELADFD